MIMGTLGHKVFEPLVQKKTVATEPINTPETSEEVYRITRSGCNATCKITAEGCVVLSGSTIRKDIVKSCPDYVKTLREEHRDSIDENYILKSDLLFKSPSTAAGFVIGGSANGNAELRTVDGKTLKEVEETDTE
jgi:hypothetical protein